MNLRIPNFEGRPVEGGTKIKMSGAVPMDDLDGVVIGIDDVVQMVARFRCINVHHDTNQKGELIRVHVLRPVQMDLLPIEGHQDGIIRALPQVVYGQVEKKAPECTCGSVDSGHTARCELITALGMAEALSGDEKLYLTFEQGA